MAVADRGDHVAAVIAQVLRRLLPHDVPLVRDEGEERNEGRADDCPDRPAREGLLAEQGGERVSEVHAIRFRPPYINVSLGLFGRPPIRPCERRRGPEPPRVPRGAREEGARAALPEGRPRTPPGGA